MAFINALNGDFFIRILTVRRLAMGCSASQRQSDVVESISASSSVTSFQKVRQSDAALVMADVGAASAKKKGSKAT